MFKTSREKGGSLLSSERVEKNSDLIIDNEEKDKVGLGGSGRREELGKGN